MCPGGGLVEVCAGPPGKVVPTRTWDDGPLALGVEVLDCGGSSCSGGGMRSRRCTMERMAQTVDFVLGNYGNLPKSIKYAITL